MKYIKYSLVILLLAVIGDMALIKAANYPITPVYYLTPHFKGNEAQWTPYRSKTKYSRMSYTNSTNITDLTNPCTNCQIKTSIHEASNYGSLSTIITKMDETKEFNDAVIYPGDYQIEYNRHDWSILTTYHTGHWTIQPM